MLMLGEKNGKYLDTTIESMILTRIIESNTRAFSIAHQSDAKLVQIDGQEYIYVVAFLVDGKQFVSGDKEGKIRRWRVEDGKEVGMPMDAGSPVLRIAVSRDGKWIVSGTESGVVTVWAAENHDKVTEFQGHKREVLAVDVSPDGRRIATGSADKTARIWSLLTSQRLLRPLGHDNELFAVKFSPNGRLIATAASRSSVRIYDSQNRRRLVDFPIRVPDYAGCLAWASDSTQLFVLSCDGIIHCLDVSTGKALSQSGPVDYRTCIVLADNDSFIAATGPFSLSFWDTATRRQIGAAIEHHDIDGMGAGCIDMTISVNYDLVIAADKTITIQSLWDIIPSSYLEVVSAPVPNARCMTWISNSGVAF